MRYLLILMLVGVAQAVGVAWDNAAPLSGQTITGTDVLVNGSVVGSTTEETFDIGESVFVPGDNAISVRHVGTIDGFAAVGDESAPLLYTVADSGAPGVAPMLRFHQLDGAA